MASPFNLPEMTGLGATIQAMNAQLALVPFAAWLGAEVIAATPDSIELRVPWRVEFGGIPGMTHGGVLAGIADAAAYMVLMAAQGGAGPTIDMSVDFHRSTANGTLFAEAHLLRAGATISTVEVRIRDAAARLIASGRGVFLSQARGHASGPARILRPDDLPGRA